MKKTIEQILTELKLSTYTYNPETRCFSPKHKGGPQPKLREVIKIMYTLESNDILYRSEEDYNIIIL